MWCKLLPPGESSAVEPVAWRPAPVPAAGAASPAAPANDPPARLAAIEKECEEKIRQARAAGRREGEAAGRGQAQAELQAAIERLGQSLEELAACRPRLRRQAEADLIKLALAIARRVLRRELTIDPEALQGLVRGALEKLDRREISRVRIHASQAAALSAWLRRQENAPGAEAAIEVVADPGCQPGSIIFETPRGNLDASVETQLEEIERGLADCLRGRS